MPRFDNPRELRAELSRIGTRLREIGDHAANEQRGLSPTEQREYLELRELFENLDSRRERLEMEDDAINRTVLDVNGKPVRMTMGQQSGPDGSPPGPDFSGDRGGDRWIDHRSGREVRILTRAEPFGEAGDPNEAHRWAGLTLGGFCRAMVCGPRTDVERRALAEGSIEAGGAAVPEPLLNKIIDAVRREAVVMRAGAATVPMSSETLSIARIDKDPKASWKVENAEVTETDMEFRRIELRARTLIGVIRASRELLEDAGNLDQAITRAFASSLALELDRVALVGSGEAPEPRGLLHAPGVIEHSMGEDGAPLPDASPGEAWRLLIDLQEALLTANAPLPSAWIMHPWLHRRVVVQQDAEGRWLTAPWYLLNHWHSGGALEQPGGNGNPQLLPTTAVPLDMEHGEADNATALFTGYWPDLLIGLRRRVTIEVLRERYADRHQIGFVASLRADVQLARPSSFARLVGITVPAPE